MNKKDLKRTLETLLSAPQTRHETLSMLCELAPLSHKRLQETITELHTKPKTKGPFVLTPLTLQTLKHITPTSHPPSPNTPTMRLSETESYLDQLASLLTDTELMTPLTPNLSAPKQLRRTLMIQATRALITEAQAEKDLQRLNLLAIASKKLGDWILSTPERLDEGVGVLLEALAPLGGGGGVHIHTISAADLIECARWRPLLGALRRGLEGAEVRQQTDEARGWDMSQVDEAVREDVAYVVERVRVISGQEATHTISHQPQRSRRSRCGSPTKSPPWWKMRRRCR